MTSKQVEPLYSLNHLRRLVVENKDRDWRAYGNVNVTHDGNLTLFSYMKKMFYSKQWNFFEIISRGLILNNANGDVVARPFDKFWNYGQGGQVPLQGSRFICRTLKIDGSLGIQYKVGKEYRITLKTAFDKNYGLWATEYLNTHCRPYRLGAYDDYTMLYEINTPDNRIVVQEPQGLTLIGVRNRLTGIYVLPNHHLFKKIADLVQVPSVFCDTIPIDNERISKQVGIEGFVSWWTNPNMIGNQLFKHKTLWYRELAKEIDMANRAPKTVRDALNREDYADLVSKVENALLNLGKVDILDREDKKQYALRVKGEYPKLMNIIFEVAFHGTSVDNAVLDYMMERK